MKQSVVSICHWELELNFRDRDQIRGFVKLLMDDVVDYDFECEKTLGETGEQHYITVKGCWANNLVRVAKMAELVDHKDSFEEDYET